MAMKKSSDSAIPDGLKPIRREDFKHLKTKDETLYWKGKEVHTITTLSWPLRIAVSISAITSFIAALFAGAIAFETVTHIDLFKGKAKESSKNVTIESSQTAIYLPEKISLERGSEKFEISDPSPAPKNDDKKATE